MQLNCPSEGLISWIDWNCESNVRLESGLELMVRFSLTQAKKLGAERLASLPICPYRTVVHISIYSARCRSGAWRVHIC